MATFCLGCGNSISESDPFCPICGRDSSPSASRIDPGVAFGLAPETSGKAIFSLVCGLLFILLPLSLVAVVFGHLSLSEIRRSAGRLTGRGLAITGLIFGYLGTVLFAGFIGLGIYERMAMRTRIPTGVAASYGNSVISSVRALNTAEIAYAQAHRTSGYTCSLYELSGAWGIGGELAKGRKNGYVFALRDCTAAKANGPIVKYRLVAYPTVPGQTGTAAYCSDESDVIRMAPSGSADDCMKAGTDLSETEMTHPRTRAQPAPR
ncbi:MAG TPA: DUF4190 domain-containing protein [Candidatus Sulfotelmatobacter sp.]|nr:DUF4190 domain-containing protein [Candidatus Sulfotelmatobacter sp.]